jgi:hypothetical protein
MCKLSTAFLENVQSWRKVPQLSTRFAQMRRVGTLHAEDIFLELTVCDVVAGVLVDCIIR